MFDYEEGSIFDPEAFMPKKKPEKKNQGTIPNSMGSYAPAKINLAPVARNVKTVGSGAFGIVKTFQKVTSPKYQLNKANRQIKEIEAKEKLMEARQRLAKKQAEYNEAHPSFIKRLIAKQEQKKSVYTGEKKNVVMPKA